MVGYYFHIGDYRRDTMGLNSLQHGIYHQLLDEYYLHEKPLHGSNDPGIVSELKAALRPLQRPQVDYVLTKFFVRHEDGLWHHKRADKAIGRYRDSEPDRAQRKANNEARRKRFNAQRSALFAALGKVGCTMPWNTKMAQLRSIAKRMGLHVDATDENGVPNASEVVAQASNWNASENVGEPRTLNPEPTALRAGDASEVDAFAARVASVCASLGIANTDPFDARLRSLLAEGATVAEFLAPAGEASATGKGWAWVLGAVSGRRADAARTRQNGPGRANGGGGLFAYLATLPNAPGPDVRSVTSAADVSSAESPADAQPGGKSVS